FSRDWSSDVSLPICLVHVERDGHGPEGAVGEAHLLDDAVVVGPVEEAAERGEAAVEEELDVAELAVGEGDRGEVERLPAEGLGGLTGADEVAEGAAVGGVEGGLGEHGKGG